MGYDDMRQNHLVMLARWYRNCNPEELQELLDGSDLSWELRQRLLDVATGPSAQRSTRCLSR